MADTGPARLLVPVLADIGASEIQAGDNGLGRYEEALASAESAAFEQEPPNQTGWGLIELVEAALRSRQPVRARDALRRLSEEMVDGSDWAGGIEARSRALVSEGEAAERSYLEAVERPRPYTVPD